MPLLLLGCGGAEAERRALCERALLALEPEALRIERLEADRPDLLTLRYALGQHDHTLTCRFERGQHGRAGIGGITGSRAGEVSAATLFLLETYVLGRAGAVTARLGSWPYLAQQLLNATAPAAIYALLALGFSLIYGLLGRINLAFGEFCAYGTLAALAGALLAGHAGSWPAAGAAVLAVLPLGLALGAGTHALIARPLMHRTSLAFLVATLGLSLALSEGIRLAQRSRTQWFPPGFARPLTVWQAEGAVVAVSTGQILVALLALVTFAAIMRLLRRSDFGRAWRACADDPGAAALVGIDIDRIARRTSMLAAACATLAGAAVALHYGIVGPDAGLMLGFKALTAAIVGGIGSPAGAVLGGLLIGLAETLWAAYLPGAWRDVVVFAILAFMLVLRPYGLRGEAHARDNPMLWRGRNSL